MSRAETILVIDDEPQIQRFLETSLGAHGYSVVQAMNGEEALASAEENSPDLIILDLGLPDMDGIDVLGTIRKSSAVPIIVLTVREQEVDKVGALDMGADDYVTKPFSVGELMARVRSCLRRNASESEETKGYDFAGLSVDVDRRVVVRDGQEIKLTPKEFEILRRLVQQAGKVVTHQTLLRDIWGPTYTSETHYLRVFVGQLRGKIEDDPAQPFFILTEPGVGYRLREPE